MKENDNIQHITVGIVGIGLMGSSIIASLLVAGHKVRAIAPLTIDMENGPDRIKGQLIQCEKLGLFTKAFSCYMEALSISEDYAQLSDCRLVIECIIEDVEVKESVFRKILASVDSTTILASNTSAIPISSLQKFIAFPERFIGIHWAEPAFATRFLEIICGDQTSEQTADWVYELAHYWGKEPTLLRKDIRGFVTNRLLYAVYRESLSLVEDGRASIEAVDKAFRYDAGSWITFMGIFRRMEFMGFNDYLTVFRTLFPGLNNSAEVPPLVKELAAKDARGIQNCIGFYHYTKEESKKWAEAFASFNDDIYKLALEYPAASVPQIVKQKS